MHNATSVSLLYRVRDQSDAEAWDETDVILDVEADSQPATEARLKTTSYSDTELYRGLELGRVAQKLVIES